MESDAPAAPAAITLTLAELRALIEDIVDERLAERSEDELELSPEFEAILRERIDNPGPTVLLEELKRELELD